MFRRPVVPEGMGEPIGQHGFLMHTPSLDALLAMPDNHLQLLHAFVDLIVDQATGGSERALPHQHTAASSVLVPIELKGLARSCVALGWNTTIYQQADVPVHLYLAGTNNGLVPRITAGRLNTWAHTEGMSAHSVLQFQSILAAIEAAVASRRTSCPKPL